MNMKKRIWKRAGAVLMALALTIGCIGVNPATAKATEYSVTPAAAVLYTGSGAEVFTQPDPTTLVTVLPGDLPLQVTGMTSNGYFQVVMDGGIYYVYGKALSAAAGTNAYKLTSIDAKAALVGDAATGQLIYAQNAYDRLAPASTTKIMTVLLVMDAIAQGKLALDTPVMVSPTALAGIPSDASHVSPRLQAGEVMNVLELLECVMLSSCKSGSVGVYRYKFRQYKRLSGLESLYQCIQSVSDYKGSVSLSCISGHCINAGSSNSSHQHGTGEKPGDDQCPDESI